LPQDNLPARVLTDNVERVFTDIDANNDNSGIDLLGHDVLLIFGAPCQPPSLAGQEHGRTISLPDMRRVTDIIAALEWKPERRQYHITPAVS
jgi:C-5 cytosine-specific DNA methylase